MQRASLTGKRACSPKERQKHFRRYSRSYGLEYFRFKNSLSELSQIVTEKNRQFRKAKQAVYKLEDNLRMKMYSIEDLEILRKTSTQWNSTPGHKTICDIRKGNNFIVKNHFMIFQKMHLQIKL